MKKIYLGTAALEKNRWEPGRIPTFNVSDFVDKAINDGFYGIELWEYHYTKASDEEKAKLAASGIPFIFNSYTSFAERNDEEFKMIGDAVKAVGAEAIKFNIGSYSPTYTPDMNAELDNLKRFCEYLPENVKMLCECHANTVMEVPETAGEILSKLDKERFGAILHLCSDNAFIDRCYDAYGDRIWHIHSQYRGPKDEAGDLVAMDDGTGYAEAKLTYFKNKGFDGSLTIEFVKFEDTAEAHYVHAVNDLKFLKTFFK